MQYELIEAKDGNLTLKVNDFFVYSKYKPIESARQFIESEFQSTAEQYILVGLGLGYHLIELLRLVGRRKLIFVFFFDEQEYIMFEKLFPKEAKMDNIIISKNISDISINERTQIIIPDIWMKVIPSKSEVNLILKDIKIKQRGIKIFSDLLLKNFHENLTFNHPNVITYKQKLQKNDIACLISSGPSLDYTKQWLKKLKVKPYILAVGSALKVLLQENIIPDAVIITDAKDTIDVQLKNTNYTGDLLYLCTVNNNIVKIHEGDSYILFQEGFDLAINLGEPVTGPLLSTGGSVATTGFSLLSYLGFEKIVLFGQDLAILEGRTHANSSTSGIKVKDDSRYISVKANNGEILKTLDNLYSYLRWFNSNVKKSPATVYNTALNGAQINGTIVLDEQGLIDLMEANLPAKNKLNKQ